MVSYFYYLNKFLVEDKKKPNQRGILHGISDYIKSSLNKPISFSAFIKKRALEWKEHVRKCLKEEPDMVIKYEDLSRKTKETLKGIFYKLGADVGDNVIKSAIDSFSFKKLAGRDKGVEDNKSFFRKGIIGDWKNKFSEKDKRSFKEIAGYLLIELGYEKNFDW